MPDRPPALTRSRRPPKVRVPPAWHHVPAHVDTYGPEVADLADSCGMTLDGEQRLVLDALYAVNRKGTLVGTEAAVIAPRQNLKTHALEAAALADLVLFEEPFALWTAHRMRTSTESFLRLKDRFENYDHLSRLVFKIRDANGKEGIELRSGARLDFMARGSKSGRGLSGNRITADEGRFLQESTMGALVPTLSAKTMQGQSVQIRYGSSAGGLEAEVLRLVRKRGRAGNAKALAYLEWCAPHRPCPDPDCRHFQGTPGCVLDDRAMLAVANSALDRRIAHSFIVNTERSLMSPAEFARERLGWWQDPAVSASLIDAAVWQALLDSTSTVADLGGFGFDVSPNATFASIAAAGWRTDGLAHVELIQNDPGTAWCLPRLIGLWERWRVPIVLDPANPGARAVVEPLEAAGVTVLQVRAHEYAIACQHLVTEISGLRIRHQGWPALALAISAATRRPIGDGGWGWARKTATVDITSLVAITLALHGLVTAPAYDVLDSVF